MPSRTGWGRCPVSRSATLGMLAVVSFAGCAAGVPRPGTPATSLVRTPAPTAQPKASAGARTGLACLPADDAPTGPSEPGASGPLAPGAAVAIAGFAFSPTTLRAPVGTTVRWTDQDLVAHTVTADDGSFDSGVVQHGGTCDLTLASPGTIAYHCTIHPAMVATIEVTES